MAAVWVRARELRAVCYPLRQISSFACALSLIELYARLALAGGAHTKTFVGHVFRSYRQMAPAGTLAGWCPP